ncbi:MAG: TIM barrel protein [Acidobacteriia bacterium]|nr:TIM barrel protein [Terriglobia bacterium]
MNRRAFNRTLAGAALGAAALPERSLLAAAVPQGETSGVPYKLSVMLWTVFNDLPFEQRLENVAAAGYRCVELVGEYKKWSEEDFRRANAKRRELGISFNTTAGLAHGVADPRAREAFLSDLRQEFPLMEKLECPAIIVMSGYRVEGLTAEAQHASCVEGLKRAAEIAEKKGVTLWLENIDLEENPRYYLWSMAEAFQIAVEVNHPRVKILYDFFHAQVSGGNLMARLEKNISQVACLHIADVPGRHEPGTGEINYPNLYKKLVQLKYAGYVTMEFLPSGDPVATLRAAREEALRGGE